MIHPIYGETDYRKIDPAQLNRNIPKGRGMIKWAPFATMPEQFLDVKRQIDAQTKIERPELSEAAYRKLMRCCIAHSVSSSQFILIITSTAQFSIQRCISKRLISGLPLLSARR